MGIDTPATPAMMALPATPLTPDASANRKFYTLTASLREIYDDNVNTTHNNPQASFETELSPSVLVDFPMENSDFSARYTFDITYYSVGPGNTNNNGNGNNGPGIQYTHEFVAQYAHAFSDRFNLNLADQFRKYTEPSMFESTGTNYQNGPYVSNAVNGAFTAQWTPIFSTTTTYANTIIQYDDAAVALTQNDIENTGSQTFSFAVFPKISLSVGGIGDNITYDTDSRGYTTYTGFGGAQWQVLPSLSITGRGGISYLEPVGSPASFGPYAALSINWTLGARSSLSFDYAHEITPSDGTEANGQVSDRFSANFRYDITSSLSSHLTGIFTNADVTQALSVSGSGNNYTQYDYDLDTGLTYHYNTYLDFSCGITLSGVSTASGTSNSGNYSASDYARDQAYVGVRGTY